MINTSVDDALKVSFIHLFIYSFIHLFIYSFIHLFVYSFIHLFIYSWKVSMQQLALMKHIKTLWHLQKSLN